MCTEYYCHCKYSILHSCVLFIVFIGCRSKLNRLVKCTLSYKFEENKEGNRSNLLTPAQRGLTNFASDRARQTETMSNIPL